jgi:hypothetical protein
VPGRLLLITLLLSPLGAVAQQKPDFSGERTLNREASTLSAAMAGVQSGRLVIQHREPKISVRLTLVQDGKPFETVVERATDGREVSATQPQITTTSSFRWEGSELVFLARGKTAACDGTVSIRYRLEDGGRRLRAIEAIRGCGRDQDNVWVFDSQLRRFVSAR